MSLASLLTINTVPYRLTLPYYREQHKRATREFYTQYLFVLHTIFCMRANHATFKSPIFWNAIRCRVSSKGTILDSYSHAAHLSRGLHAGGGLKVNPHTKHSRLAAINS